MTTIRAHFDGNVIVPDEPVDLPIGQPLRVTVLPSTNGADERPRPEVIAERLRRLALASGNVTTPGINIPDEALRRENLYEDM